MFDDDLKEAADDLFALAGVVVSYTATESGAIYELPAIIRGLTPDDLVSAHVLADAVVCQIREADLEDYRPARGDIIERYLGDNLQTLAVVDRFRDESGVWRLTCQQNIRVTP